MTTPLLRKQRRDLLKLVTFLVISALFAFWVAAITAEYRPGGRDEYHAVFEDVSGLETGDQVRVAGVNVGKVERIKVRGDSRVEVTFAVKPDLGLNEATHASIKYRNLIGGRILELSKPEKNAAALSPGGTIPVQKTVSALDLDSLLNGFKPLFAGLNPAQINELSGQLVQVLQGQDSAVQTLVSSVGSFTTTIAQRQELVTQVIGNLNSVLGTVDGRRDTLGQLIGELSGLVDGLEKQDSEVLTAAGRIDRLARNATVLVHDARTDLAPDLRSLATVSAGLNSNADALQLVLDRLPRHYPVIQDSASYGNFFNFYLCGVRLNLTNGEGGPMQTPWVLSDVERCRE